MSHESDAERIVLAASTRILSLQNPTLDDARTFIRQHHEALTIYTEIYPDVREFRIGEERFQEALDSWDNDKSDAILSVLTLMDSTARAGDKENVKACVKCAYILAESPLLPAPDPEAYGSLLRSAYENFETAMENPKNPKQLKNIILAKLIIIGYSTHKYCPTAFENAPQNPTNVEFHYLADIIDHIANQPPAM